MLSVGVAAAARSRRQTLLLAPARMADVMPERLRPYRPRISPRRPSHCFRVPHLESSCNVIRFADLNPRIDRLEQLTAALSKEWFRWRDDALAHPLDPTEYRDYMEALHDAGLALSRVRRILVTAKYRKLDELKQQAKG